MMQSILIPASRKKETHQKDIEVFSRKIKSSATKDLLQWLKVYEDNEDRTSILMEELKLRAIA